jgi:hypothetical protein
MGVVSEIERMFGRIGVLKKGKRTGTINDLKEYVVGGCSEKGGMRRCLNRYLVEERR